MFLVLSGCQSDSNNTDSDSKKPSVTISWWGGESRNDATIAAVKQFEQLNDVEINIEYGAWSGWETRMAARIYSDSMSDVMQINQNWITMYESSDRQRFYDLGELSDIIDFSQYSEESIERCSYEGEIKAVPVSLTSKLFYFNENTFRKAGIDVPETLDELYAAGETFRDVLGDDYYPLSLGEYDRMILMVYYLESVYGREWITNKKLNYSKDEIIQGLKFISSLEDRHVIPDVKKLSGDGALSLDKNVNWITGKYAGIFEWDSTISKFIDSVDEQQHICLGGYLNGMGSYDGGFSKISLAFAISENTKYPELCARLINFLLNEEEGVKLMGVQRGVPLSSKARQICTDNNLIDEMTMDANTQIMERTKFIVDPYFEYTCLKSENGGVYFDVMSGLSYGDYTVSEAAEKLIKGIDEVLQ